MAIYCQKCGSQHPDDAIFCIKCGNPLGNALASTQTSPIRWEYKDVGINLLNVRIRVSQYHGEAGKKAIAYMNNLIVEHLRYEGQYGWQAEGLTDFQSLAERNAVDAAPHRTWLNDITEFTYRSVRIRLRRPATS